MIERAFCVFAIATALLVPVAAQAAPTQIAAHAAPAQMTRVPAQFRDGQVYLKVSLNNAAPVWMAFATDAPGSTLYAAHPARATVHAGAISETVTFRSSAAAAPRAPDGSTVAGRLGSDWLGDRVAEVRAREHEVWLSAPIDPPPAAIERPVITASR